MTTASENRPAGIGRAAELTGASVRALRYYQEVGLLAPSCTGGGTRRYNPDDLARVRRIRELQEVLGFQLEEIRSVLTDEDQVAALRAEYHALPQRSPRRREIVAECLLPMQRLQSRVEKRYEQICSVRAELTDRIAAIRSLLGS